MQEDIKGVKKNIEGVKEDSEGIKTSINTGFRNLGTQMNLLVASKNGLAAQAAPVQDPPPRWRHSVPAAQAAPVNAIPPFDIIQPSKLYSTPTQGRWTKKGASQENNLQIAKCIQLLPRRAYQRVLQ